MPKKSIKSIQEFKDINKRTCETARQRIQLVKIVERMNRVALGEEEASKESIKAAFGLIDKLLTTKTEHETTVNIGYSITDDTLKLLRKANERIEKVIEGRVIEPIDSQNEGIDTVTKDQLDLHRNHNANYDN